MESKKERFNFWQLIPSILVLSLTVFGYSWAKQSDAKATTEQTETKPKPKHIEKLLWESDEDALVTSVTRQICDKAKVSYCKLDYVNPGETLNLDTPNMVLLSKNGGHIFGKCTARSKCTVKRMMAISTEADEG